MLTIRSINSPSKGTMRILQRKIRDEVVKEYLEQNPVNSLGLIQGQLAEIIIAGDIAEKASSVQIAEIAGVCPQHVILIGVFGDNAAVSEALNAVEKWDNDPNKQKRK